MHLRKKFKNFINPAPIIVVFVTATGVLMHDMHLDKATVGAISLPVFVAATGAALDKAISPNYHTHVERAEFPRVSSKFRSSLPKAQPTREDNRRYIQKTKLNFSSGGDAASFWPSV